VSYQFPQPPSGQPVTQSSQPGYTQFPASAHIQYAAPPAAKPGKKRRIFLWFFLAVQIIFVIWLITGLATVHTGASHAEVLKDCANGAWQALFKSYNDCIVHDANGIREAGNAGKAIGAALVIVFWMVVDVILGVTYGVYRLATRSR
jgi:ABC-type phosphate transport system permease subunit